MTSPAPVDSAGEVTGWRVRAWQLAPLGALLALSLLLRGPITVVPPLVGQIRAELGLDAVTAGLLTSIPVLCFGLLTPSASSLLRRVGANSGALYCLVGVLAGSVIRVLGGTWLLLAGTAVIGASLAVGNLVVPMLIGREYMRHAEVVTSCYTMAINLAVTLSTALAVPVAHVVGWRWSTLLASLALGVIVVILWVVLYPPGTRGIRAWVLIRGHRAHRRVAAESSATRTVSAPVGPAATPRRRISRLTILLTLAFAGHTLSYYAVTAWLPSALADLRGMTSAHAGVAASWFQLGGVFGPFLVPLLLTVLRWSQVRTIVTIGLGWMLLPAGMAIFPAWWFVWTPIAASRRARSSQPSWQW